MLFCKEIDGLHDDSFQGSTNDRRIFSEVFFGNDHDRTSKRCLVTGAINFDCDYSRQADKICSNSGISAIKGNADSCNIKEDSREYSTLLMRKDHEVNGKRMKLSDDNLSYHRPNSEAILNSSTSLNRVFSSMSESDSKFVSHSVTCHIIESFNQSITSSCYLVRRPAETSSRSNMSERNISKCGLSGLDGSDKKEGSASKAIASPVSQESFATKILVTNARGCATNKSSNIPKVAKAKINRAFKKDPSPLLRGHMLSLLRAAGWETRSRKRLDRKNGCKWNYLSPEGGKPIREFHKAWNLCGQSLLAGRSVIVEKEGKQWASMTDLWSDLSLTLSKIEGEEIITENTAALAHQWCLLDPFANMVLIEKKWGRLRAGEIVHAKRIILPDTSAKDDGILSLTDVDSIGNQCERHSLDCIHGSSLVNESMVTNCDGNFPVRNGYRGHKTENLGQFHGQAVKALKGVHGIGTLRREISGVQRTGRDLDSLQSFADCDHSNSWMLDFPITVGKLDTKHGGSESVSTHQDSGTSSPGGDRRRSDHDEAMASEVDESLSLGSSEGGGRSFCRKVSHNHLSCKNEGLSQFNDQDSYSPLTTCLDGVSSRRPLVEDSCLVVSYDRETEFVQLAGFGGKVHGQSIDVSKFEMKGASFAVDAILKRKDAEKSKKISKSKLAILHRNERLNLSTNKAEGHKFDDSSVQPYSGEALECLIATNPRSSRSCEKSGFRKFRCGSKKLNKFSQDDSYEASKQGMKLKEPETRNKARSTTCQLKDDDLLISAIIRTKTFKSTTEHSNSSKKFNKTESLRKCKSQKGRCRLLPRSMFKGGKHMEGKWPIIGVRTVLSWLIESGVISLNEVIQYRDPKDECVVKDGLITRDGILCKCCNKTVSVSEFKSHAGFRLSRSCVNLFMESGKPFMLCQLEAWSTEYRARKNATQAILVEEVDQNDDSCGLCGNGGELICCDNCPSTFHQACLYVEELPEGNWYCSNCTCQICGDVVHDKEASKSPNVLKCLQCESKYHEECLKGKGPCKQVVSNTWFCGESCQEVSLGLQSHIGLVNILPDGFSWTLLRCVYGDQRVHSAQRLVALKAECNSKLAVALKIMEECFLPMVDPRTGIDMIPHVVYNWGSEFARLNYHGFYTMVLEKDDVLMSVASIRIHGVTVAEMPLIATCSLYRRQGMCRRLMSSIEKMLKSLKVGKLVISAIPGLVETWTLCFGFQPLEDDEKRSLRNVNLMVFPGTVWLKKPIFENQETSQQRGGSGHATPLSSDDPTRTVACSKEGSAGAFTRQPDGSPPQEEDAAQTATGLYSTKQSDGSRPEENAARTATGHTGGIETPLLEEGQDGSWTGHFPKLSCEEPDRAAGGSQLEIGCSTESVVKRQDDKESVVTYDDHSQVEKGQDDKESVVTYVDMQVEKGQDDKQSVLTYDDHIQVEKGQDDKESVVTYDGDIQVEKGQDDKESVVTYDDDVQVEKGQDDKESVVTHDNIQVEKRQDDNWTEHFSKLSSKELVRKADGSQLSQISQPEMDCGVESLVVCDEKELTLDEQSHAAGIEDRTRVLSNHLSSTYCRGR